MGNVETAIIEIIKWIRESVRPVIVLCVMSILALVPPHSWLVSVGMDMWMQKMHPWIVLVFVGSSLWLATFPIENAYRLGQRKKYLHNLASDEKKTLQPYILNNKTVHCFSWWHDGGIINNPNLAYCQTHVLAMEGKTPTSR
jgi:hypothetical protein